MKDASCRSRRRRALPVQDGRMRNENAMRGNLERHGARKIAPIMPVAKSSAKRLGQSTSTDSQTSAKRISQ
jgi:hypothetical protein